MLPDKDRTKEQLVNELAELRQRLAVLEKSEVKHKQAEKILPLPAEDYQKLFDLLPIGITMLDMKGVILYCNPAVYNIGGYTEGEIIGKHFSKIASVRLKDIPKFIRVFNYVVRGKIPKPLGITYQRKDGTIGWTELNISLTKIGGKRRILVIQHDITERKQAEEEFENIFNLSPDMVGVFTTEGGLIKVNPSWETILGYKTEELLEMGWAKLVHPDDVERTNKEVEEQLKGSHVVNFVNRYKCKDGSYKTLEWQATYAKDGIVHATARDITERKQAEEVLRESEAKYKGLVSNVKLGVFRSTPGSTGRFLEVNPAMKGITGYSRKGLLQMNVSDLYVNPEEREAILGEIASGKGKATKELAFRKKDGTEIVVSGTKVAVRDDAGEIIYFDGIVEDITERKQAEQREKQLQQELYTSSRLASIGELAAGVAHEINNPLTGILGFSERLLRKSTDEIVKRDLERIHNEARRAARVVVNLLTFARSREPKREFHDINDILQKSLELRDYELETGNITVVTNLDPSLPEAMVDFQQIQEVFLNIILNAEQAMTEAKGKGKLLIQTQEMKNHIRISFTDDGPGIPAKHIDKLFDPFFTTRGERGGTGLGLSVCHGIVAEHGGKLYAKSKPAKGAKFIVELPCS